jgi:hypothetical protein
VSCTSLSCVMLDTMATGIGPCLTALEQGLSLDGYQLFSAVQTGVTGVAGTAGSAGAAAGKM